MTSSVNLPTVPGYVNWLVRKTLRSPLHPMLSRSIMLLTVTGRKTGARYVIPIRYLREGDVITCYTDGGWWRNLRGGATVELRIAGRNWSGNATATRDSAIVTEGLARFLQAFPSDSKYYGVRRDADGRPNAGDIDAAAAHTTLVRIELAS
ncbi:nitroreductase/quinone reductase family protein [Nocardia arthritidis]|uniref:DUF385 domain-containing protein n=1 Tax=Nocardia arthritidis TaxID=228602 RepID=A0A6G9YE04_9NOCA|nr:nitroreductase/quinone reductase family protein [Nocardia arthritidis]QIS11360.1 DUF385 domain-containing protein [Nocardia arthritidis]